MPKVFSLFFLDDLPDFLDKTWVLELDRRIDRSQSKTCTGTLDLRSGGTIPKYPLHLVQERWSCFATS